MRRTCQTREEEEEEEEDDDDMFLAELTKPTTSVSIFPY